MEQKTARSADIKVKKKLPLVMVMMVATTVATLGIANYMNSRAVIIEKRGVSLVGKAGDALESIAASVLEISDNVSQIAQAAGEQSNGLGEINVALEQLDQATQHNAAMAEETSAAAQALSDEAKQLTDTTNQLTWA